MIRLIAGAAFVAIMVGVQQRPIDKLGFMYGCWERNTATRIVEEQWTRPRGTTMMGTSRTLQKDTTAAWEFMRIYTKGDRLVFAAQPSGQAPAEFESTVLNDSLVVFSNPQHDFPQRVIYRKGTDSLLARIEGAIDGRERAVDFRYGRVGCEL